MLIKGGAWLQDGGRLSVRKGYKNQENDWDEEGEEEMRKSDGQNSRYDGKAGDGPTHPLPIHPRGLAISLLFIYLFIFLLLS